MSHNQYYHAMELTLQKRFSHGLSFMAAYTLSKNMLTGDRAGRGTSPSTIQHNSFRDCCATELSWFLDRTHVLNLSYYWELPFGPGKPFANSNHPVLRQLVGGWSISGIQNYASGTPVRVVGGRGLQGGLRNWVVRLPGVPVRTGTSCGNYEPNNPASRYLNIDAFAKNDAFTFGDTRVLGDVRTCGYGYESLSIMKRFPIREEIALRFGADIFNLFNGHDWTRGGAPTALALSTNINSASTFGRYAVAQPGRSIQLSLRIDF